MTACGQSETFSTLFVQTDITDKIEVYQVAKEFIELGRII